MNWFQKLLPREDKFFDLFESHAVLLVAGAEALKSLLDGGEDASRFGRIVVAKEDEADKIAHQVMQAVRRTFITPFDRGDIQALIESMDDAIDQMNKTVKTISLFEILEFEPLMREMAALAVEAAKLTRKTIPLLREIATNASANAASWHVWRVTNKTRPKPFGLLPFLARPQFWLQSDRA